jgi:hypothetical protein
VRRFRFLSLSFLFLFSLSTNVAANPESRRKLREAVRFYKEGRFEQSRRLFMAVARTGDPDERRTAAAYLRRLRERAQRQAPRVSSEEARAQTLLREGAAEFEAGNYDSAELYFIDVARSGSPQQKKLAAEFLRETRLKQRPTEDEQDIIDIDDPVPTMARRDAKNMLWSGYIRTEAAYRVGSPSGWAKERLLGFLSVSGQPTKSLGYRVSARAYYNAVFDWTSRYPPEVAEDERKEAMLRDAYVDYSRGNLDIRAGKQQIVWGEALALFYADVVNAKDFREFVLPDFDYIRIPQWGLDVEYALGDLHLEGVWLPVLEFHRIGRPGAEFGPPLPTVPGVAVSLADEREPADSIENSEFGGRIGYKAGRLDSSVFVFRSWNKFPDYERTVLPGRFVLTPTHRRLTYTGFTAATETYDTVLKGEVVLAIDRAFPTTDLTDDDGLVTRNTVDYCIGADRSLFTWDASVQVGQQRILNFSDVLIGQRQSHTNVALGFRRGFRNNTVEPQFVAVADLTVADWMLRSRVDYKFAPRWKIAVGADFLGGSSEGLFGLFQNRDRVYSDLTFTF